MGVLKQINVSPSQSYTFQNREPRNCNSQKFRVIHIKSPAAAAGVHLRETARHGDRSIERQSVWPVEGARDTFAAAGHHVDASVDGVQHPKGLVLHVCGILVSLVKLDRHIYRPVDGNAARLVERIVAR